MKTLVSNDVLNVLSIDGINGLLESVITAIRTIIAGTDGVFDMVEMKVWDAVMTWRVIDTFQWMPEEWTLKHDTVTFVHDVVRVDISADTCPSDIPMRLEPFLSICNRNVDVFKLLYDTLMTLHSIVNQEDFSRALPVNFSFFKKEFDRFAALAETNDEVKTVLDELCVSLDECSQTVTSTSRPVCERWSIADPVVPRMRGHITKSTSSKVDLTATPARTTMVNK